MYAQDNNSLPVWSYNLSPPHYLISQPILIHFWWELYHADPSHIKPMSELDPDDIIGRTFVLPPQENGERLRAKVT